MVLPSAPPGRRPKEQGHAAWYRRGERRVWLTPPRRARDDPRQQLLLHAKGCGKSEPLPGTFPLTVRRKRLNLHDRGQAA